MINCCCCRRVRVEQSLRQLNYKKQQSRQPVIQVDFFAYIKSQQDPKTIPVLTAVDVATQVCMAAMVPDKPSMMDHMVNHLQTFIFERGRTQGILQSDNEDTLNALLKAICVVGVSSCVLLFVVELVAVVVVVLLLCVLCDARVVVPHRCSPGCTRSLSLW